jgi:hypothetical protein
MTAPRAFPAAALAGLALLALCAGAPAQEFKI